MYGFNFISLLNINSRDGHSCLIPSLNSIASNVPLVYTKFALKC